MCTRHRGFYLNFFSGHRVSGNGNIGQIQLSTAGGETGPGESTEPKIKKKYLYGNS